MAERKFTATDLKDLQSMDLGMKIQTTMAKFMEFYNHFNGQVYVAFSGGKDSTVLLDIVRKIHPEVPAVFVDTGLEYPEVKEFVKSWDNVEIIRPRMSRSYEPFDIPTSSVCVT